MERWKLKVLHGTNDANKEVLFLRVQKKVSLEWLEDIMTWLNNDIIFIFGWTVKFIILSFLTDFVLISSFIQLH